MIVYDVRCAKAHVFEAWFRNSAAFDEQAAAGEIACPVCGDTAVTKAPMAPAIARSRQTTKAEGASRAEVMAKLRSLRAEVETSSEHVGATFPEEARKIHYGEVAERNIYGEAKEEEARELRDEGVEFHRIPWLGRRDS